MLRISNLFVILALVLAIANVDARKNLRNYCKDLSKIMASNTAVYTDPQAAFKSAEGRLKSLKNIGVKSRYALASAWKAVINDAECDSQSADHVSVIVKCRPEENNEMVTLDKALRNYSTKCLGSKFWDQQLKNALGKPDSIGLPLFLSDRFIDRYQAENPTNPMVHFGTIEGSNCCDPSRGLGALLTAMEPLVYHENADPSGQQDGLENLLKKYLFNRCIHYEKLVRKLMERAEETANSHPQGQQAFIEGLSREFQNTIFRYKYCTAFEFLYS